VAQYDFIQYAQVVGQALGYADIGGSQRAPTPFRKVRDFDRDDDGRKRGKKTAEHIKLSRGQHPPHPSLFLFVSFLPSSCVCFVFFKP
jgi:hypothetical protein